MRTLIEILDYEQTENIISPLVFNFDEVIYLYDEHHDNERKRRTLCELLKRKGIQNVQLFEVNTQDESFFDQLVKTYPNCVFNLSNGTRTLLVQMTRFCERTKQRCYTLNFQRKTFINLRGCDDLHEHFRVPHMSVDDVITLSAGEILNTGHALPEMSEEMEQDMMNVINVMNSNSSAWTRLLGHLAKALRDQAPNNASLWISRTNEKAQLRLLEELERKRIVHVSEDGHDVCVTFKNKTLMRMFADSGAWLEYQAYLECFNSRKFDDVRISTIIDWNKESKNRNDPTCELDLIVIKNCIPAFVSCKMNKCSALDLYEIRLLADKLGGSLGKAAIISKASALKENHPLALKAKELGIKVIGQEEIEKGFIAKILEETISYND